MPDGMDNAALDFTHIHGEIRRKGVARVLLWQEYRTAHPDGCERECTQAVSS